MLIEPVPSFGGFLRAGQTFVKVLGVVWGLCAGTAAWAAPQAVILMYPPLVNEETTGPHITVEQFETHLAELTAGGYTLLPLADVTSALAAGADLPEKAVAVTFDEAHISFYRDAWPRLKATGIPVTLFVTTAPVDQGAPGVMTWDQVRELRDVGVHIGHRGHSGKSLTRMSVTQAATDIEAASLRFEAELGAIPSLFAYPEGDYDEALVEQIQKMGFKAAFAQYSSVATGDMLFALPRFAQSSSVAGLGRFRLVASALALPVSGVVPEDPRLTANPPAFGFSLTATVPGLSALACYPSHLGGAADLTLLGDRRVEVRFEKPFPRGRSRINCTMPGPKGRWYWFGRMFLVD